MPGSQIRAGRWSHSRRRIRGRTIPEDARRARIPRGRAGRQSGRRQSRLETPTVCLSSAALCPTPPLAPNSCAAVTMFHVLEHVHDPQAYLAQARRLLKPGGCRHIAGTERRFLAVPSAGKKMERTGCAASPVGFSSPQSGPASQPQRVRGRTPKILLAARQSCGTGNQSCPRARSHGAPASAASANLNRCDCARI